MLVFCINNDLSSRSLAVHCDGGNQTKCALDDRYKRTFTFHITKNQCLDRIKTILKACLPLRPHIIFWLPTVPVVSDQENQ